MNTNAIRRAGVLLGLLAMHTAILSIETPWVHTYTHTITSDDRVGFTNENTRCIQTSQTAPFTQLLFSWNAKRPVKGYFTFWVKGREADTKVWSSWHKTIEWGDEKQVSFLTPSDSIAHYAHVRFEVTAGKMCDAYAIRVQGHNGADVGMLHSISVTCANFTQFKSESAQAYTALPTVHVLHVPRRSQFALKHPEKKRLCSPTSCAMLVEFITGKRCKMHEFAHAIYDKHLDTYGNWPLNMAHAYDVSGGVVGYKVTRLCAFSDIYAYLKKGLPVAVSVRGVLDGAPQAYANGHLLVVVGFDGSRKKVICHDPAFKQDHLTMHAYDLTAFLRAWECSRRLAYCIDRDM